MRKINKYAIKHLQTRFYTMGETRSDKFKRLAEKRMKVALRQIQLIGNLSNRNNYDYSADQVKKMFSALNEEIKTAESAFKPKRGDVDFKL